VLIVKVVHAESMIGVLLFLFFVLLGPLAFLFGVDSRDWDERDQRGWWPGTQRADFRSQQTSDML
jgi:hypothetical protein